MFDYESSKTDLCLSQLLKRYRRNGRAISVDFRKLVPNLNFADRATHLIHPYPAKLLMHIPYFFLANNLLSRKGDIVADPFCGSGTVLLESQLSQRRAIGADSNPLARLISQVKTRPINSGSLDSESKRLINRIAQIPKKPLPDVVNLDHWFYAHVAKQLQCISEAIAKTPNDVIRDFFLICFSSCVKRVSLCDPRLSVPVRLRLGQYPIGHQFREQSDAHLRKLKRINVMHVLESVLDANRKRMMTLGNAQRHFPRADIVSDDARCLGASPHEGEVQLIITSPPYPGAQKYIRSSSLSLGWLGLCQSDELSAHKHRTIGREEFRRGDAAVLKQTGIAAADRLLRTMHKAQPIRATIAGTYLSEMRDVMRELWRVLRPGGYLVLVAANNQIAGTEFKTQEFLRLIAEEIGFNTILRLIDSIRSRGLMTKRNKTASVITREWVLVFAKD